MTVRAAFARRTNSMDPAHMSVVERAQVLVADDQSQTAIVHRIEAGRLVLRDAFQTRARLTHSIMPFFPQKQ